MHFYNRQGVLKRQSARPIPSKLSYPLYLCILYSIMKEDIQKFWTWFVQNEQRFWNYDRDNSHDYLHEIQEQLAFASDSDEYTIALEFAEISDTKKRLEISADGVKELFDAVIQIAEAAPELDNWEFVAFRQPALLPFSLNHNNMEFDTSKMFFLPYEDEEGELNLAIYGENFKTYREKNETDFYHYALITIDNVIGEYNCVMRVKGYDFLDTSETDDNDVHPIEELPDFIEYYYSQKE
jgi:hypothetical protein